MHVLAGLHAPKHGMVEMFYRLAANGSSPSHLQALLPDPSCLRLNSVEQLESGVCITVAATGAAAHCPAAITVPIRSTASIEGFSATSPGTGRQLICVSIRRFRCRFQDCPRATFVESLPLVCRRYGRQTSRLSETIRLIGYVLGGEAGARLSGRLGMKTSPDTVLRRVKLGVHPCRYPASRRSVLMTGRGVKTSATGLSSSIWNAISLLTCCRIALPIALQGDLLRTCGSRLVREGEQPQIRVCTRGRNRTACTRNWR